MNYKFKIGDLVQVCDIVYSVGIITKIIDNNKVKVYWIIDGFWKRFGNNQQYSNSDLMKV